MHWYIDVLKKYAVFSGRARREEYWMYTLFNVIAAVVLAIIGGVAGTMIPYFLYLAAIIVPSLAVSVRRLHDTGRSGSFVLFGLIPLVGGIILLVFFCTEGDRSQNMYGPDPKFAENPGYFPPPVHY
ncbi:DUF805 domain-containing protein [Actinacidiphila epipremni]|jgi:uncharacterized membrane protein YhaH (DUF805 family)|uniref:DUF805 domain-containing protein n=1 Tax=Actinacidiphila epipremni TaxID=2053013 RepID=A0ABX1A383_9ACTN|nr:DUF805 domain-containing protein [Actinacidiphila epipremni]NJP48313.1 DUF805 domain-containing protein [Actinacidiphila epipremni]